MRKGQGAVAHKGRLRSSLKQGESGRESDAGASMVIQGLRAGFGWGCRLGEGFLSRRMGRSEPYFRMVMWHGELDD